MRRARRRWAVAAVLALAGLTLVVIVAQGGAYMTAARTIWTIAGNGALCDTADPACGDGPSAVDASLTTPAGLAVAADGSVFVSDSAANRVRRITTSGAISTVAGTGEACADATAACGDGGDAADAQLTAPQGLAIGADGALYIADSGDNKIRRVSAQGTISTVAGSGQPCPDATIACGDGGPADEALLNAPRDVALDGSGALYVADTEDNRLRRISAGAIKTHAGTGGQCASGPCGDGGAAVGATLRSPAAVEVAGGDVYIADSGANRVRRTPVAGGTIATVAGSGAPCPLPQGPCGDGGAPASAQLSGPLGIAVAGDVLYVADSGAHKIRRVTDLISTIAGTGQQCGQSPNCGDGGAATSALLKTPSALALDANGDLLVADSGDGLVRWLTYPREPAQGTPPPAEQPAAPDSTGGTPAPVATAANAPRRATSRVVRCSGLKCRLLPAGSATKTRLRRRAQAASGAATRVRVELRRGGRVYATGSAVSLRLALTLVPQREVRRGTYRLRILLISRGESRRRNRIVRVR